MKKNVIEQLKLNYVYLMKIAEKYVRTELFIMAQLIQNF